MNYTTIEKQIINQADKDTEYEIRKITEQVSVKLDNNSKQFTMDVRWNGVDHKVFLPFRGMIVELVAQIIRDEITEKRRRQALDSFLNKFNTVVTQIESLGIELEGIAQQEPEEQ